MQTCETYDHEPQDLEYVEANGDWVGGSHVLTGTCAVCGQKIQVTSSTPDGKNPLVIDDILGEKSIERGSNP